MPSLADELPPEIVAQIHPDRRKNEAAYWAIRDSLLDQYQGRWVFANNRVISHGNCTVPVFHAAEETGEYPFIFCVGLEDEPCRIHCTGIAMTM